MTGRRDPLPDTDAFIALWRHTERDLKRVSHGDGISAILVKLLLGRNSTIMATVGGQMVPGFEWAGYDARGAVDELTRAVGAGDSAEDNAASRAYYSGGVFTLRDSVIISNGAHIWGANASYDSVELAGSYHSIEDSQFKDCDE